MHQNAARRYSLVAAVSAVLVLTAGVPPTPVAAASKPLWTERGPNLAPSTVTAPNWVAIVNAVKPAVVNITTEFDLEQGPADLPNEELEGSFDPFDTPERLPLTIGASGFIVNPKGFIVTNAHVIDPSAEIRVTLADGRAFPATVVGEDPETDIALLKIDADKLPAISLGDSDAIRVGEPVMAIGNPFGLEETVTTGVVSGTRRVLGAGPYNDFIQTDASINPGNSGGPLINARGRAVGINAAIVTSTGGSIGIGFAIPINMAKFVLPQLAQRGRVDRGWLGVSLRPVTRDVARSLAVSRVDGALVSGVATDSPASAIGVQAGDIIVAYDGRKIRRVTDLAPLVAATPVGKTVSLAVVRRGQTLVLAPTIARLEGVSGVTDGRPRMGFRS